MRLRWTLAWLNMGCTAAILFSSCSPARPGGPDTSDRMATGTKSTSTESVSPLPSQRMVGGRVSGPPLPVRVAYPTPTGNQAIANWIAREAGLFEKYGLEVELEYVAGTRNVAAMITGEVQIGGASAESIAAAVLGGADLVMIVALIPTTTQIFFGTPEIRRVADLRGKHVGITNFGAISEKTARRALDTAGLVPGRDVEFVPMNAVDTMLNAMRAGAVQAGAFTPPVTVTLRKEGFTELMDLSQLNIPYLAASIATSRRYLRDNEEAATRYLRAVLEAIKIWKTQAEFSKQVYARNAGFQDSDTLEEAVVFSTKVIPNVPIPTIEGMRTVLDLVAVDIPSAPQADPNTFIEPRLLRKLEQEGFVRQLWGN